MGESRSHKAAKSRAAGKKGKTEVPLRSGKRLDAKVGNKATEVERSGDPRKLELAAQRLKESRTGKRVLQVPNQHMDMATAAMRKKGISGSVKNMSGTKRRSVSRKKK